MVYHPHSIYTNRYTKSLQDLLNLRENLIDFFKKEEAMKSVMRVVNDCFFKNNLMYKSDFNHKYFNKQTGVTCIQTEKTVFKSKQQIIISSTKHMIGVMKNRMQKIKNARGLGPA